MIPKKIHYCWFGNNPIPDEHKAFLEGWKELCPDYEIVQWNESNYDVKKNKYMYEAYEAKKWGFVPDYARLDIIYNHGGIYLDTDVELIKNPDDLLTDMAFVGFEEREFINFGSGFAAVKGHETIKQLRDHYDDLSFVRSDGSYDITPSPKIQTANLVSSGLIQNGEKQIVADITVYPVGYFGAKDFSTGKIKLTENTYAIHHYSASWFTEKEKRQHARVVFFRNIFGTKPVDKVYYTVKFANELYRKDGIRGVFARIKGKFS